jgi:hypothetical protein
LKVAIPSWVHMLLKDKKHHTFFVTGGWGAAKSTGAAIAFVYKVLQNPSVPRWWVVGPTYEISESSLVPTVVFILEKFFNKRIDKDFQVIRSKPPRIRLKKSGQVIHFHSGDRPERMVSATIGGYWISEAGIQKQQVFENMLARARDAKVDRVVAIIEGTPEGDGPYRDMADFEKSKPELGHRRFVLHTADNIKHLDPGYIPRIEAMFEKRPEKLKSYLYGEFASFNKGTAYWDYFESRNLVHGSIADPTRPIIVSWDFQNSPLCWIGLQKEPQYIGIERFKIERVVAIDEAPDTCKGLLEACAHIIVKFPPAIYKYTPIHIDGGHDGYHGDFRADESAFKQIRNYLQAHYQTVLIIAPQSAPAVRDRLSRINDLFAYQRYVIDSRCHNLRAAYNSTSTKPGTWELVKNKSGKDTTHYSDAGDYGAMNAMRGETLVEPQAKKVYGVNRI